MGFKESKDRLKAFRVREADGSETLYSAVISYNADGDLVLGDVSKESLVRLKERFVNKAAKLQEKMEDVKAEEAYVGQTKELKDAEQVEKRFEKIAAKLVERNNSQPVEDFTQF